MTSPKLPKAAEPECLSDALRRAGVLGVERVSNVAVATYTPTLTALVVRLHLAYDGAAREAPRSLILKTARPDRGKDVSSGSRQEVAFYRDIAPTLPAGLVPRCFEATADGDGWHLLLEDLGSSHSIASRWPVPPALAQCEKIVLALAPFHAAWWNDARLGDVTNSSMEPPVIRQRVKIMAEQVRRFADSLGDTLSATRRTYYAQFLEAAPRLMERRNARHRRTLVHGDAHVWNFFVPTDDRKDNVRIFDWAGWHLGMGADDLAYMMALHWHPELRGLREGYLLDRYHHGLQAQGVQGFDRAELQEDYRLSVLLCSTIPVLQHGLNIAPLIWWNHFERIHLAVDDLGCRELLMENR
jgi:aminoglycoside phosphotransferase (APT) family kinase protein